MTCREMTSFLEDYMAGELAEPVRIEFERHTVDCSDCHVYLAQYRTTVRASGAIGAEIPHEPLPVALVAAILAAVQKKDETRS
jgi:anti-sigma factor RsiW